MYWAMNGKSLHTCNRWLNYCIAPHGIIKLHHYMVKILDVVCPGWLDWVSYCYCTTGLDFSGALKVSVSASYNQVGLAFVGFVW